MTTCFGALTFKYPLTPPSVQSGSLVVRRLPLLPLLRCKASTDILWRPFVSPCASMRTQESDVLLRKKTLGVRRVRSLVPAAFSPVSPPKDESSETKVPESPQETFESDFVSRIVYLQCSSVTNCAGSLGRGGHRRRGSAAHMRRQHAVQTPPRAPARGCAVHVWLCDGFPGFSGKRLYSSRRHGPWQDFAGCYSFVDVAYSGHHRPVNMPPWPRRVPHISRTLPNRFSDFLFKYTRVIIFSCLCAGDKLGKRIHQVHTRLHHGNKFILLLRCSSILTLTSARVAAFA